MAKEFICVRLVRIEPADLNYFEFDLDLTWAAFFLNSEGKILGRYGGRDASGPDERNSLEGLRFALQAALARHRLAPREQPVRTLPPLFIAQVPARKGYRGDCVHCHQVKEILRQEAINNGKWDPESRWVFPPPENIGLTLARNEGNRIEKVKEGSPAAQAGVQAGAILKKIQGQTIFSFADAQYALHKSPPQGKVSLEWNQAGQAHSAILDLPAGWKKTNLTWRPSLLDLFPSLTVYGTDLTVKEKKSLGLEEKGLAFRTEPPIHSRAKAAGIRENDIIIGIDNKVLNMDVDGFLGHIRQNYLVGETIRLTLIRDGKKQELPILLKN